MMRTVLSAAAFASCLIALPAAAQEGPSLEFTTNYIVERCSNVRVYDGYITFNIAISGDRVTSTATFDDGNFSSTTFDVNDVRFRSGEHGIAGTCITGVLNNAACMQVASGRPLSHVDIGCRDASAVLNALNRFQTLHGGPRQPNDPFAN